MAQPEHSARKRGRLRRRVVLRFTQPTLQSEIDGKSTGYNEFKDFIRINKIPRRTGKPGGLVKLRFIAAKDDFVNMVESWDE